MDSRSAARDGPCWRGKNAQEELRFDVAARGASYNRNQDPRFFGRCAQPSALRRYLDNVMHAAGRAKMLVDRILGSH